MNINCFVLFFTTIEIATSSKNYENDFRFISYKDLQQSNSRFSAEEVTSYSQLLFDVARNQVLVGARDSLFRLSLPNLTLLEYASWAPPELKTTLCLEKGQSEESCHNYIKVLLTDGKRIFTCGTNAFSPLCSWREIQNIGKVFEWVNGVAKCSYNPSENITALMDESGDYYVGGPTDFHGSDAAIYRNFGRQTTIRTKQYDSKWLNEPQFVGSFETDQFIYFFFREAAVEYINCGKIVYSRIARICKNDQGGGVMLKDNWTTFLKARLNCSVSGDYPSYFDEIQSMVYVPGQNIVYATFTTPSNSIAGSAICAFNLTAINAAFSGPFKTQLHTGSSWDKQYSQHQDHFACKPSQNHSQDHMLENSKYQLMDNAVQATALHPLYLAELERFTHITVDVISTKLHTDLHIIYVATTDGLIKKLSVFPNKHETCVIEIWQPISNPAIPILSLQYLKETDSIYIGTKFELLRVNAHHCSRHVSRNSCHNAMDPYCGWNDLEDACTPAPHGNPLTKYWVQDLTACPILDATTDGGWSSWSNWEPCSHRNSRFSDSSDECMCQIRSCNNPTPKNGGKSCFGVSIAVTNCTIHGDWTPWSAWSACSATCGIAVKTRRRTCSNPTPLYGGRVCVGQDRAEVICAENPPCPIRTAPPIDGKWSDWDDWTSCTVPCGKGFKKRHRRCDSPKNGGQECVGSDSEFEICNSHACPDQKRHASWSPWFLTNTSEEEPLERRFRYACKGPVQDSSQIKIFIDKKEERTCKNGMCSSGSLEDPPKWSNWSAWTECSVSCGTGIQIRTRLCEGRGECQGLSAQTRECNLKKCKSEWNCWTDWSSCSVSCGLGKRRRHRSCQKKDCDGESIQEESCEGPPCESILGWNDWTVWSLCDENNEQHRQRKCKSANPGSQLCQGQKKESRMCVAELSNDLNLMRLEAETATASTGAMIGCVFAGIVVGVLGSMGILYLYFRKRKPYLPSSPHYITAKQNPYITVPLQDLSAKRQGASTSNSILNNSHNGTIKSNKCYDYDASTIKRNSHSLNNGHMKSDNYYYD